MKPHKRAGFNRDVLVRKKAVVVLNPSSYYDEYPTWRLSKLEVADPYGFHALTATEADEVRKRLEEYEKLTWREVLANTVGGRPNNHLMPVSAIKCKEALKRLDVIAPDVDDLMSLRISGPQRIWGIMSGSACQLVFWDPQHLLYPIEKK